MSVVQLHTSQQAQPVIAPPKIFSLPSRIFVLIISNYSTGTDLRSLELTHKIFRQFFNSPPSNKIWYQVIRRRMKSPYSIAYSQEIPYKQLFLLFAVRLYRPVKLSWLDRRLGKVTCIHQHPLQILNGKCIGKSCLSYEIGLYQHLILQHGRSQRFNTTFREIESVFGARCFYNAAGQRTLWCHTCECHQDLDHGLPDDTNPKYTDCHDPADILSDDES